MSRIPKADWKDFVPKNVGEQVHVNHTNCPNGRDERRRLYIKRTDRMVLAYCHNCGGYAATPVVPSLRTKDEIERLLRATERDMEERKELVIPDDIEWDSAQWPSTVLSYLRHYDIDPDCVAGWAGGGYSASWNRLFYVHKDKDGKPDLWQARNLADNDEPKYLTANTANSPKHFTIARPAVEPYVGIVLTEDILSAVKIADNSARVFVSALLGTSMTDRTANWVVNVAKVIGPTAKVLVWLDSDVAGKKGAIEIARRLNVMGCPALYVKQKEGTPDAKSWGVKSIKDTLKSYGF